MLLPECRYQLGLGKGGHSNNTAFAIAYLYSQEQMLLPGKCGSHDMNYEKERCADLLSKAGQ
jgi:hypothetical protein